MKFCIVGTGRCGTKLLGTTFHGHPALAVFNESHWVPKMYEFFGEQRVGWRKLLDVADKTTWVDGENLLEVNFQQSRFDDYGEFREALQVDLSRAHVLDIREFSDVLAGVLYGAEVSWGDKTPDYGYYMGLLHQLWPQCKFIHLIRRPVATAHGMSKHPGFRLMVSSGHDNWCPLSYDHAYANLVSTDPGINQYLQYWLRRVIRIRDEAKRIPDELYTEVAYENLVRHPDDVLRQLALFVEVEAPELWLEDFANRVDPGRLVTHFKHCR